MAIHFITGRPHGGKSFFATKQILAELKGSERLVVTNVALKLADVAEWCHGEIEERVDLGVRLRLLKDDEVQFFWRHLPGLDVEAEVSLGVLSKGVQCKVPDAGHYTSRPGILFVIDEVHLFFNARDWQNLKGEAQWFFSQHRHLRCDILLVTQHPELVDKNMRRWAQDYTVVRNLLMERFVLGVRGLKRAQFRRATYFDLPGGNSRPMESGYFRLNGEERCYDTAAGVGLVGRVDTKERRGGRNPAWLLAAGLGILVGGFLGIYGLAKGIGWGTRTFVGAALGKGQAVVSGVRSNVARIVLPVAGSVAGNPGSGNLGAGLHSGEPDSSVYLAGSGVATINGKAWGSWRLSDGRVIRVGSEGWESGGPDFVIVRGRRYEYREGLPPSSPSLVSPGLGVSHVGEPSRSLGPGPMPEYRKAHGPGWLGQVVPGVDVE